MSDPSLLFFNMLGRRQHDEINTYREKVPNACPKGIVGKLPPPSRIGHVPLVEHATGKVHDDGDNHDDRKHPTRPHAARLARLDTGARMLGSHHEQVGALIRVSADEGDGGSRRDGFTVAAEGKGRGLAASRVVFGDMYGVEGARITRAAGATSAAGFAARATIRRGVTGRGSLPVVIVSVG